MNTRVLPFFLPFLLALSGCSGDEVYKETRLFLGTTVNIKALSPDKDNLQAAVFKSFEKIKKIEDAMSRFDGQSELSAVNNLKKGERIKLSSDTYFVLQKALALCKITDGALDVTVLPLVELWKTFKGRDKIPDEAAVKTALLSGGFENILLDEAGFLAFAKDGVRLDLSAIAKGYAVDEAVKTLRENGVKNCLVDAGGDIYCMGGGPGSKGWRVGIRHPREEKVIKTLVIKDKAVATSGDYEDFFIAGGKRYSHIIDPRSGYPVSGVPMSATVIAPDCITADALATAIMVMGPAAGIELAEKLDDIEAIVIGKSGDTLFISATSGMSDYYEK